MIIPFVIDNQQHKMADVLNDLLSHYRGHSLDIATAYFNVGGWQLLRDGLNGLGNFRLLLGDEPEAGADLGLREAGAKPVKGLMRDLARENFNEQTLRLVEDLIAFLYRKRPSAPSCNLPSNRWRWKKRQSSLTPFSRRLRPSCAAISTARPSTAAW